MELSPASKTLASVAANDRNPWLVFNVWLSVAIINTSE